MRWTACLKCRSKTVELDSCLRKTRKERTRVAFGTCSGREPSTVESRRRAQSLSRSLKKDADERMLKVVRTLNVAGRRLAPVINPLLRKCLVGHLVHPNSAVFRLEEAADLRQAIHHL